MSTVGLGAGSVALHSLMAAEDGRRPDHAPTARSVIFLFMSGGPSQIDTFDPKPALQDLAGQDVPALLAERVPRIKRAGLKNLMPSPWTFRQHGKSGQWVSELFPQLSEHADELCVIRSMTHRNPVHGPGECMALTGSGTGERPSVGAWSVYGLGSEPRNLPGFVTMNLHTDGMQYPQAAGWGTGFLPKRFQGTVVNPSDGIRHIQMPEGVTGARRLREIEVIRKLNARFQQAARIDSELQARIRSYELAFEMQSSVPELFDIGSESKATHAAYGLESAATRTVGRACMLARRMVERGVRFVQVRVGGWDAHGNIKANHERMALRTDRPVAALLHDLRSRDLLKDTLVVWGGEFGRTPTMEGRGNGRDHSPAAYTVWLAGGGTRGGTTIGQTDEIGYTVTQRPVKPVELHATILHAVGIDASKLTFDRHGLTETPLGVTGGQAVHDVFG